MAFDGVSTLLFVLQLCVCDDASQFCSVSGVRGTGGAGVTSTNQLDGGYEQNYARRNYDWIIRSAPGDGNRYTKDSNAGACVTYGSKVWLQNAATDGRFRK